MEMRAANYVMYLLLASLLMALGCSQLPKQTTTFNQIEPQIKAITVMPPAFDLTEMAAFSASALSELNHDIEIEVKQVMEALVTESRFELRPIDTSDEALAHNDELRDRLFVEDQVLESVGATMRAADTKSVDVQFSGDVEYFMDITGAECFLFVRGAGWFMTTGAAVKDAIIAGVFGGAPSAESTTTLEAFLVGVEHDNVLWYNSVEKANRDPRKPSDITKTCQDLMKPLFGRSEIQPDKSRDEVVMSKYEGKREE